MKTPFFRKSATYLMLGFAIIALIMGSCAKGNDDDDEGEGNGNGYKITLKVDGVAKEFADEDFPPFGSFTDNGTQYSGAFRATGRASSVGFQVYDLKAIIQKDYSGLLITPTSEHNLLYGAVVSYAEGQDSYSTQSITDPTVHVEITEITATSVRGKFSGILKSQNGKPNITVSDGNFYVNLK